MPSVETKIWMALKGRATSVPGGYPIAWPAQHFTKPSDANGSSPYVEVANLINNPRRILIKGHGAHDRLGILQISLMLPVSPTYSAEVAQELAGRIAAHFPADLKLPFHDICVRIDRAADVDFGFRADAYWQWPVSIPWRCFA